MVDLALLQHTPIASTTPLVVDCDIPACLRLGDGSVGPSFEQTPTQSHHGCPCFIRKCTFVLVSSRSFSLRHRRKSCTDSVQDRKHDYVGPFNRTCDYQFIT